MVKKYFSIQYLFILIPIIFVLIVMSLYLQSDLAINKSKQEIYNIEKNRSSKLSSKILKIINEETSSDLNRLFLNNAIRDRVEKLLAMYVSQEFKYIYIVYIDKKGFYRYLLDATFGADRGEFGQKFSPMLSELWKNVIVSKKPAYSSKQDAFGLWATHLTPIVEQNKVKAIIALDISTTEYTKFSKILSPFDSFLKILIIVSIIIIFTIFLLTYLFYKLQKQSIIDPLTKLYNRLYLNSVGKHIKLQKTAIMMLDIDYFKKVNDSYGHDAGDVVLASVAKKILIATRLDDKVIRYGGEEFLILIKYKNNKNEIVEIAKRIKESISKEKIRVDKDLSIQVTISIGVNINTDKNKGLSDAIKTADNMLYLAKNNGRNRIEINL